MILKLVLIELNIDSEFQKEINLRKRVYIELKLSLSEILFQYKTVTVDELIKIRRTLKILRLSRF